MGTDTRTRHFMDFSGKGSGTYDLTWSQKQVCTWMEQSAPRIANMNLAEVVEVDGEVRIDDVEAALKFVIERHEVLRTRIHLDPAGMYQQVVYSSGRLPIDVRECGTTEEADGELAEIKALPFTSVEWPLRVCVLTVTGEVVRVALCVSHLAADGWGMGVLREELTALLSRDPAAREALLTKPVLQPREQAAWEQTNGHAATRRAEAFFADQLQSFPNQRFPLPRHEPESPRFPEIMMESESAAVAIARLAENLEATPHAVVAGAISVLLRGLGHTDRVTFRLFSANRLTKAGQSSLGSFYQVVPVSVDVGGHLPFHDVIRNARQKTMRAYLVGPGDPVRLDALAESVTWDRGVKPDLECFINLHSFRPNALKTVCGVDSEKREDTRVWKSRGHEVWEPGKFYFDVWDVSEKLLISLWGDTELFPTDVLSDILLSLEGILVRGARDSGMTADELFQEAAHALDAALCTGLEYVDTYWVDLAEIREALTECLSTEGVHVTLDRGADSAEPSLTAYLDLGCRSLTPEDVHRFVVDGFRGRRFVMAPHRYVICDRCPDDPGSAQAWAHQAVIAEGPGR